MHKTKSNKLIKGILSAVTAALMFVTTAAPAFARSTLTDVTTAATAGTNYTLGYSEYFSGSLSWQGRTHTGIWVQLMKTGSTLEKAGFCADPGDAGMNGGTYSSTAILDTDNAYNKNITKAVANWTTYFNSHVSSGSFTYQNLYNNLDIYQMHAIAQLYIWAYEDNGANWNAESATQKASDIASALAGKSWEHMVSANDWNTWYNQAYSFITSAEALNTYSAARVYAYVNDYNNPMQRILIADAAYPKFEAGYINVKKVSDDGAVGGISFTITNADTGAVVNTLITNGNGVTRTQEVEANHNYTVTENVPANYTCTSTNPQTVYVGAGTTATVTYNFSNVAYKAKLHVIKTDAESGKTIPAAGATFVITDANGTNCGTYTSDENGEFDTAALHFGSYTLTETVAPAGYEIAAPVQFTVYADQKTSTGTDGIDVIQIKVKDSPIKTALNITKQGYYIDSFTTDEDGNVIPVYKKDGAHGANAEFRIVAAEDIVTGDGTVQ